MFHFYFDSIPQISIFLTHPCVYLVQQKLNLFSFRVLLAIVQYHLVMLASHRFMEDKMRFEHFALYFAIS